MTNMDFVLIGDKNELSFVRGKSGEYIKFIINSNIAYINDEIYHLPASAFADGDNNIYVPVEFIDGVFTNITVSADEKDANKITVDVAPLGETGTALKIRRANRLPAVDESPNIGDSPVSFLADLTEYERYFNPPADEAREYLVLINHANPLDPIDYIPPDLTEVIDARAANRPQFLRYYPAKALEAFLIEARANGMNNITVTSAYRSYARQSELFNAEVNRLRPVHGENAESVAAVSIMPPGHSEHQTGLGVDMHTIPTGAAQSFGNTPEGRWLAENAHHFGFILRYPEGMTHITGIIYEPWHFRYVGRFHATRMFDLGLVLEEYREQYLN
jgi:D-alanyl-D-alanine carboxypeptidase